MEVILLEKVAQLGDPGDLVNVKAGYGRNFLIPTGKAVRADDENKAEYEKRKEALLSAEADRKDAALQQAEKMQKGTRPTRMPEKSDRYQKIRRYRTSISLFDCNCPTK